MTVMFLDLNYAAIFATSRRAAWEIEDVIGPDDRLDFRRPFLPEEIALIGAVDGLSGEEQLLLNHIRSHEYLSMFGLVEEFIVPFVFDQVRPGLEGKDNRMLALLQFAEEEVKHIELFKRFHRAFTDGFGHRCGVIGPAKAIGKHVLSHDPLAVALFVLMIEWATQSHYLGSVRDARGIDSLFAKLLRSHWIEEAQHARLDTLLVRELAAGRSQQSIDDAIGDFLAICAFIDEGLRNQADHNFRAFERAAGRSLPAESRGRQLASHHRSLRETYLLCGLRHEKFRRSLRDLSPTAVAQVEAIAADFG